MTLSHPTHDIARATAIHRVSYRMTDQMGVVYYGNYLEMFEIGRGELFRSWGLSYREMESDGFMLPCIHASCDYLAPARYDDVLEIETWVAHVNRVRINFGYEIRRQGEAGALARGATHHAFISPDGRPKRLSPKWWERLQQAALKPGKDAAR